MQSVGDLMRFRGPVSGCLLAVFILLLLSACEVRKSASLAQGSQTDRENECRALFSRIDELVASQRKRDVQSGVVPGFPYLRVNRFLASFKDTLDAGQTRDWLTEMRALDKEARKVELANISPESTALSDSSQDLETRLDTCGADLLDIDLSDPARFSAISSKVKVDDNYRQWARALGLYPLSKLFVAQGIKRLQERTKASFAERSVESFENSEMTQFSVNQKPILDADALRLLFKNANKNSLGIPHFEDKDQNRLFAHFAPVWEIDGQSEDDKFGVPFWSDDGSIEIQTNIKRVYQHLSYTRVNGEILPQFNYVIWFPARPATGAVDILAGKLDGITWRVTVSPEGEPLIYDAMHNCGCYHLFFPVKGRASLRNDVQDKSEPILVPTELSQLESGQGVHIRIAATTHYLTSVYNQRVKPGMTSYGLADYNELRSLGRDSRQGKSMFNERGLVTGTQRAERWLLWPMGVASAGAMRQWGHHAVAFIGRRHFDDPNLFQQHFDFDNSLQLNGFTQ